MEHFRGMPFPLAVTALFVIVLLRAGGTYALGRLARSGASRTRVQRLAESPRFERAQELLARWGAPVVVLSFLTVGFQTLVNLAAGIGRMPLRRYLPALVIGGALWAILYATVGFVTFAGLVGVYQLSPVGAVVGGLVLVGGLVSYIVWQVRRSHRTSAPLSTTDVVSAPEDRPGEA
ncbi:MAG: VTT domain-containing protein [Microlunatus sp.]